MTRTKLWAAVLGLLAAVQPGAVGGIGGGGAALAADAPYPKSTYITDFDLDWSSYRRLAEESDNWAMTWAADGRLYAPWGDGGGFRKPGRPLNRVSLGLGVLEGNTAANLRGVNQIGGLDPSVGKCMELIRPDAADPWASSPCRGKGRHGKSWGILARGEQLYMWVMPKSAAKSLYSEARLYRARRNSSDWTRASWAFGPNDPVHLVQPTWLQAGRDHADINDYLHVYAVRHAPTNANTFSTHRSRAGGGQIVLLRVPKSADPMRKDNYEYFAGAGNNGAATWTKNPAGLQAVFSNPAGVGWTVSATYVKELNRYFLITEHDVSQRGNIGIFESPNPHGPWRTVFYGQLTDGTARVPLRAFFANFVPSAFADGGRRFTLSFTGIEELDALNLVDGRFTIGTP